MCTYAHGLVFSSSLMVGDVKKSAPLMVLWLAFMVGGGKSRMCFLMWVSTYALLCGCAGLRTRCTIGGEKQLKAGKATQDSRADIHTGLHPIQFFWHLCILRVVMGYFWICLEIILITGTFRVPDWPKNSQKCAPGIVYEVRVSLDTFWAP